MGKIELIKEAKKKYDSYDSETKIPDIYRINKSGLLNPLWEKQKGTNK